MANDLTTRNPAVDALALTISSPALLRLRKISVGTVQWPGQPTRTYLAGGLKLTDQERREATTALSRLKEASTSGDEPDVRKIRLALVSKLLLTYPTAGASNESGRARAEAYLEALDDVPPWALSAGIRRWNRGGAGEQHDYRWAPAPAVLRKIAVAEMSDIAPLITHLENLLAAVSPEEAIKRPSPEERAYVKAGFEKLKAELTGQPQREAAE